MQTVNGKTALPVVGTHIVGGLVGLLLVKIRTTLEKFKERCLLWEKPHNVAEEPPPSPSKLKKDLSKSDKLSL